jgi:hypothetical protein
MPVARGIDQPLWVPAIRCTALVHYCCHRLWVLLTNYADVFVTGVSVVALQQCSINAACACAHAAAMSILRPLPLSNQQVLVCVLCSAAEVTMAANWPGSDDCSCVTAAAACDIALDGHTVISSSRMQLTAATDCMVAWDCPCGQAIFCCQLAVYF